MKIIEKSKEKCKKCERKSKSRDENTGQKKMAEMILSMII